MWKLSTQMEIGSLIEWRVRWALSILDKAMEQTWLMTYGSLKQLLKQRFQYLTKPSMHHSEISSLLAEIFKELVTSSIL